MGIKIKASNFPTQKPLDDEKMYEGKMNAYFGQKKKFQSEEIENCICLQVLLDQPCLDEQGEVMTDEKGEELKRSVFIGKLKPSVSDKSNFFDWHNRLFKEKLTLDLWEEKYQEGDLWIAMVNGQKVKVMVGAPDYWDEKNPERYSQRVEKLMGFKPNPKPDASQNPPARNIKNEEINPIDIEDEEEIMI